MSILDRGDHRRSIDQRAQHRPRQRQAILGATGGEGSPARRVDKLAQRRQRHWHRQCLTPTRHKRDSAGEFRLESPHQRRLPDPSLPRDQHETTPPADCIVHRPREPSELILTLE